MNVAIVVAYRDMGCPHRRRAFNYVTDWYRPTGWPVVVEDGDTDQSFTRASAINTAVRRAGAADVIVQADPDSLVPLDQLHRAVEMAAAGPGLVVAHTRYLYLTEAATAGVYDGADPLAAGPAGCDWHGTNGMGNVVVFSRRTWQAARGFDERFGVWGGDDAAFGYAVAAITGRPTRRTDGDMVHLWHPRLPQSEPGHPGYTEQFAILAQYRDAAQLGPEAVRRLVARR